MTGLPALVQSRELRVAYASLLVPPLRRMETHQQNGVRGYSSQREIVSLEVRLTDLGPNHTCSCTLLYSPTYCTTGQLSTYP